MRAVVEILIVEDDSTVRRLLRLLLTAEPDFVVIGEAAEAEAAIAIATTLAPNVVLMDVAMPGRLTGIDATLAIAEVSATAGIRRPIVIGFSASDCYAEAMMAAGASAFIVKTDLAGLLNAIRRAADARDFVRDDGPRV